MKILVSVTNYSKYCQKGKEMLESAGCEIVENPHGRPFTFEELSELVSDIDGVVAGVDTWNEAVFQKAPKLKVIARFGVGVDNIDLAAAGAHGIIVCNSPGINSSAVAEQAIALMMSLLRDIPRLNQSVRRGEWMRPMFHEMRSRTVGFLGFGAIARNVAMRLAGFGTRMIAYDKYPNVEAAKELHVELVTEDEVLSQSDIISIHLPATDETYKFINKQAISKMKTGAYLINTARGSIVDEIDAAEALKDGRLGGYGTDVYAEEPVNLQNPLFGFENYVATPHVSAETYENCEETSVLTAQNVLAVLQGQKPSHRLV